MKLMVSSAPTALSLRSHVYFTVVAAFVYIFAVKVNICSLQLCVVPLGETDVSIFTTAGVTVGVAVGVAVGLLVGFGVAVGLRVDVGVTLAVGVTMAVGKAVGNGDGVVVTDGPAGVRVFWP